MADESSITNKGSLSRDQIDDALSKLGEGLHVLCVTMEGLAYGPHDNSARRIEPLIGHASDLKCELERLASEIASAIPRRAA